jgi:hypothetical protein
MCSKLHYGRRARARRRERSPRPRPRWSSCRRPRRTRCRRSVCVMASQQYIPSTATRRCLKSSQPHVHTLLPGLPLRLCLHPCRPRSVNSRSFLNPCDQLSVSTQGQRPWFLTPPFTRVRAGPRPQDRAPAAARGVQGPRGPHRGGGTSNMRPTPPCHSLFSRSSSISSSSLTGSFAEWMRGS